MQLWCSRCIQFCKVQKLKGLTLHRLNQICFLVTSVHQIVYLFLYNWFRDGADESSLIVIPEDLPVPRLRNIFRVFWCFHVIWQHPPFGCILLRHGQDSLLKFSGLSECDNTTHWRAEGITVMIAEQSVFLFPSAHLLLIFSFVDDTMDNSKGWMSSPSSGRARSALAKRFSAFYKDVVILEVSYCGWGRGLGRVSGCGDKKWRLYFSLIKKGSAE